MAILTIACHRCHSRRTGMISSLSSLALASSDHDSDILHAYEWFLNRPCWKMKAIFIEFFRGLLWINTLLNE
jgi:hypothetical protein